MKLGVALISAATISAGGLVLSASGAEAWYPPKGSGTAPYGQGDQLTRKGGSVIGPVGSAQTQAIHRSQYPSRSCTPCSGVWQTCTYVIGGKVIKKQVRC